MYAFEFGEFAARKLVEMEPDNTAYVQLSNLYAEVGR